MKRKESKQYTRYIKDPLLEPYYIQLDDYCYAVQKGIKVEESGREYQQTLGYYVTLERALSAIAKDEAKNQSYNSLQGFIDKYNEVTNRLSKIINL